MERSMKKKVVGAAMVVAGLLCSCGQSQQGTSETEGAEFEHWNTDSVSEWKRVQKWEAYVEAHPKDEMGWRNLYDAKLYYSFWDNTTWNDSVREALMERARKAIPDTYTYYYLAMETSYVSKERKVYAQEAMKRLPKHPLKEDYVTWCRYLCREDGKELKKMLKRYYESGLFPPDVLYYHYNELQGMEPGGIYLAEWEDDLVPKLMIQLVFGMHRDKVLVNRNGDWGTIWQKCGVPYPDENWAETTPMDEANPSVYFKTQTLKILDWIGAHSERPVYFSARYLNMRWKSKLPKELLGNLYNEGLLMRYSSKPYDNIAVTCRNVEERYVLDYLYLPFSPTEDSKQVYSESSDLAYTTIVLLQGLLPHYQKENPERCQWLSGLLLKATDRWKDVQIQERFASLKSEIRPYHKATTPTEP